MRRVMSLLMVLAIAAGAAACGDGDGEDTQSPSVRDLGPGGGQPDDETPVLAGSVNRNLIVVSSNANLFHNADRPPPEAEEQSIADFDLAIETWLNDHLNDLQTGGEGKLEDVAAPGLLDDAPPAVVEGVTTELASPERPGLEATYNFTIAHAGIPEWIRADVYVRTDEDGSTQAASYIFVRNDEGTPVLIMTEPHPNDGGSGPTGGGASEGGGSQQPGESEESER